MELMFGLFLTEVPFWKYFHLYVKHVIHSQFSVKTKFFKLRLHKKHFQVCFLIEMDMQL